MNSYIKIKFLLEVLAYHKRGIHCRIIPAPNSGNPRFFLVNG